MEKEVITTMTYYYLEYDADETAADNDPLLNLYNPYKKFNTYTGMIAYMEDHPFGFGCLIPVQEDPVTKTAQYIFIKREKILTRMQSGRIQYSMVLVGDRTYPLREVDIEIHSIDEFYRAIWNIDRIRCFNAMIQYGVAVKKDLPWVENTDYFTSHIPESDTMELRYVDIDSFSYSLKGTNFGDISDSYDIDYSNAYGIFKLYACVCTKFYDSYMTPNGEEIGMDEDGKFWWVMSSESYFGESNITVTYHTNANSKVFINVEDFLLINDYLEEAISGRDDMNGIFVYYKKSPLFMIDADFMIDNFFPIMMDIHYYLEISYLYCKLHLEEKNHIFVDPEEFKFEIRVGTKKNLIFTSEVKLMDDKRSLLMEILYFIMNKYEDGEF